MTTRPFSLWQETDPDLRKTKLLQKAWGYNWIDASPSRYDLLTSGLVVQSSDVPFGGGKSFGVSSGTGRLIVNTSGVNFNPGTSDFLIEAYVKFNLAHSDGTVLVFSRAFYANNNLVLGVNNSGALLANANHAAYSLISANSAVPANTWRHVAFGRSGNTLRLYVNAVQVASLDCTGMNLNSANTTSPCIGGYSHDTVCANNGLIYDCRYTIGSRSNFKQPKTPYPTI